MWDNGTFRYEADFHTCHVLESGGEDGGEIRGKRYSFNMDVMI